MTYPELAAALLALRMSDGEFYALIGVERTTAWRWKRGKPIPRYVPVVLDLLKKTRDFP